MSSQAETFTPIKISATEYYVVISQADADRFNVKAGDVELGAKVVIAEPFHESLRDSRW